MTRRLILVRHARTPDNLAGRLVSVTDPDLDDLGLAEAECVASAFARISPTQIVSSPRRRALRTAEAIARICGFAASEIAVDSRLVELGFGAFENRLAHELAETADGVIFRAWRQSMPPEYPPGAETFEEAERRAAAFYDEVVAGAAGTLVVVSHGHFLRILIAVGVLAISPDRHRRMRLDHGRLAVVEWERETPRLVCLNVERLPSAADD